MREAELQAANNGGRPWGADSGRGMDQTGWGKGGERGEEDARGSTIRRTKVEIDGWAVGERAQLVEEEERKKRELSESGKFKDTSSVLPGVSGPTAGVSDQGVTLPSC